MTDYHLLLLGYALIGAISGWLGGMLGIGGGVIIVPALILLYDLANPHPAQLVTVIAIATSLSCIVFTSASAAITQARAGMVNWQIFQRLVIFFILGSYAAGWLIPHLPTAVVRGMIAGFLLFVGLVMVYAWKPKPSRTLPGIVGTAPLSFAGGMIAGTAGIAGGNVIVPGLTWFNVPIHQATATSSALGVPIAAAGALGYFFNAPALWDSENLLAGYTDILSFAVIASVAMITAPMGVKFAHRVPAAKLKQYFGVFLLVAAARMAWTAWR